VTRHAVAVSLDRVRIPLARARVERIVRGTLTSERVRDAMISVTFVSRPAIRKLNRAHLRRDRYTDVIAFALRAVPHARRGAAPIVGDVYVAPDVARAAARERGISLAEELTRLVVHGTLHVLGYEHPETGDRTRSAMWRKQERLVTRFMRTRP
jgi:probable rRNA maturation factor